MCALNTALRLFRASFSHLQEAGIDGLPLQRVVNFLGALPLQDNAGNARYFVPHGKVGNHCVAGQGKNTIAIENAIGVVGINLLDEYSRVAIVD